MAPELSRRDLLKGGLVGSALLVGGPAFLAACSAVGSPAPTVVASGGGSPAGGSTLASIKSSGIIRVGFANENPFSYVDASGKLTGSAPALLQAVFKDIGVTRLEGVLSDFGALIPSLQSNRVDIVGAGMYITPVRCQQILFGNPEYAAKFAFVVKKGNPKNIRSFADLAKNPSAKISLVVGGTENVYADSAGVAKDQRVAVPDYQTGISALQAGQVDVADGVALTMRTLVKLTNDPNIEYVELSEQPKNADGTTTVFYGSSGFRQQDKDLRDLYNAGLAKLRASGDQLKLMAPFGFAEEDLAPVDLTSDAICSTPTPSAVPSAT
jgi:polar amino acid transport system substrate-binding protein